MTRVDPDAQAIASIDYDGDGKPDLLFINSRPWPGHAKDGEAPATLKLYHNLGNMKFEDVTVAAGLNVTPASRTLTSAMAPLAVQTPVPAL